MLKPRTQKHPFFSCLTTSSTSKLTTRSLHPLVPRSSRGAAAADSGNGLDGPSYALQLCLWTMSPAIVFAPLAAKTHSVILTSGTLSPLESFAGELGVAFPQRLEANHVIDMGRQVCVSKCIATCPYILLLCLGA